MIDWQKIEDRIIYHATNGLHKAAQRATERARAKAPVRKIFKGTTYRTGASGFREPRVRTIRSEGITLQGAPSPQNRAIRTREAVQPNSLFPTFKYKDPKTGQVGFVSGDFRRRGPISVGGTRGEYNRGGGVPGETTYLARTRGGKLKEQRIRDIDAEHLRVGQLSSAGRYEIKSGRANFKAPGSGVTRVGGRLKASIHLEGPTVERNMISFHVVADAKDPETGRLYPRDQEFGTSHHPPHPFLRPALQESRAELRRDVRTATKRGLTPR